MTRDGVLSILLSFIAGSLNLAFHCTNWYAKDFGLDSRVLQQPSSHCPWKWWSIPTSKCSNDQKKKETKNKKPTNQPTILHNNIAMMHNMEEELIKCFSFSKTCWLFYTVISVMLLRFRRFDLWCHNRCGWGQLWWFTIVEETIRGLPSHRLPSWLHAKHAFSYKVQLT